MATLCHLEVPFLCTDGLFYKQRLNNVVVGEVPPPLLSVSKQGPAGCCRGETYGYWEFLLRGRGNLIISVVGLDSGYG